MMYFVIAALILVTIFEILLIRKGLKNAKRMPSYFRQEQEPSQEKSHSNKRMQQPFSDEQPQTILEPKESSGELAQPKENLIDFSERFRKIARIVEPQSESQTPSTPAREQTVFEMIQEIRGERPQSAPPAEEQPQSSGFGLRIKQAMSSEQADISAPIAAANGEMSPVDLETAADDDDIRDEEMDEPVEEREQESLPDDQFKVGLELIRKGKLDEGIAALEHVIESAPEKAEAHFNLGIAYTLHDESDRAMTAYQQAIKADPAYGKAFFNLGTLHLKQGKVQEAITHLEKAVKLLPDSMKALWNLYEAYRSNGLFSKALATVRRLIELEPEDASLHNHLGICYVKLGDYTRAIKSWKHSLSLGASSQLIFYNLGKTYELCGEFDLAKDEYRRFLELASSSSNLQELVTEVRDRLDNLDTSSSA